jgi:NitT/TauT family transport system ATP-binding protein
MAVALARRDPAPAGSAEAVVCERVTVRFTTERGTVTALENIDLTIPRGSFLTLLGPSGCGKSTLLRVMADLIDPTGGRIAVLGDVPATARQNREIGFVFQDAALLPWRSVMENVTLPLEVGGGKALPGARAPQELLALVGLTGWETAYPHELSGGMRQRVLIAMALAPDPQILVADEPTTALDATVQYQVIQTLRRLNKERNLAMLIITHDLGMVAELCDQVYVMQGGKIVEAADVFTLFDAPQNAYTASLLAAARRLHQTKVLGSAATP